MKKDKKEKTMTADEIMKKFDGEVTADESDPIELPEQMLFDKDIIDKNIIVYSVKDVGKRETEFGEVTDYDVICAIDGTDGKTTIRTNHAYVIRLITMLDKYKAPIKCRVFQAKNGRFYISSWMNKEGVDPQREFHPDEQPF